MTAPARPRPLRILIVAPSLDILGGQAVQAARLLHALRGEPTVSVDFLPVNPRLPGPLRRLQAIKYARTVSTSVAYGASLAARVHRYDVLHVFSASYLSFALAPTPAIVAGRLSGRAVLLNYHSGEAADHLRRWRRSVGATLALVDAISVPSPFLQGVFARAGYPARVIVNLVDTTGFRFRDRRPLRPVFLVNRNLEPHYNVDCVLRAFARLQAEEPTASLTVAGDGSQRHILERLARQLGLKHTTFVGRVSPDRIAEIYNASDIFLNGSDIDNQPLSILEAYASGLPVVTTDPGGIPDMVESERTGLMVARGDDAALAAAALRLLRNADLAESIIAAARAECRRYTWDAVRHEWLTLYRELGGAPARHTAGRLSVSRSTAGVDR